MTVDRRAAANAIAEFLRALGRDPDADPELRETPARVTDAYADELLAGYRVNVAELVEQGSVASGPGASSGIVLVRGVEVATVCPHHLLPSLGTATVAYLPGERLLGIGTLAALVDAFARRLALQEQIGQNVVDALMDHAGARGAYCALTLSHGCLTARGARQTGASVSTAAAAGALAGPTAAAELALALGREEAAP